jgi:hypothetical protein
MGLGSGIRKKPIPDPGSQSRGQKGTGSRIRIRNTVRHLQVCVFTVKQDRSGRGHHNEETLPRSLPSLYRGPKTVAGN